MPRIAALFVAAVALPTAAAADGDGGVDALVEAVEAKYEGVTAMRATFTQTVHNEVFGDDVQSGHVVFARPAKMRWVFGEDERQFVTDGATMWIYSKADNQVIRYENFVPQAGSAESLLTSLNNLDEVFDVALGEGEGTRLTLTPRTPGQVKQVQLVLTDDLVVDEVIITDPFDQVTELDFLEVTLDVPAPPSLFQFEIPDGANVIEAGSL